MKDQQTAQRFIELRSKGLSFVWIAREIGVVRAFRFSKTMPKTYTFVRVS